MATTSDGFHPLPEEFLSSSPTGGHQIVLQAPQMGISERLEESELSMHSAVTICRDLEDAIQADEDQTVVVDGFYRACRSADSQHLIVRLLARHGGLVLLTRPWALEWIIQTEKLDVPVEQFKAYHHIEYLQYHPEVDKKAAAEATAAIVDKPAAELEDKLGNITYNGFDFEIDVEPDYPETVAPGWAASVPLAAEDSRISASTVKSLLSDALSDFGFGIMSSPATSAAKTMLTSGSVSATPIGGPPAWIAGAIVWGLLQSRGNTATNVGEMLSATAMTPQTREVIEWEVGLPPDTLDELTELLDPETLKDFRTLRDDYEGLEEQVETLDAWAKDVEDELEALESSLIAIDERVSRLETLVGMDALETIDIVGRDIIKDEATLLGLDLDITNPAVMVPEYEGKEPQHIKKAVTEKDLVVLNGPHGTGKTTAAYWACQELDADGGHDVFVYQNMETWNPQAIEYVLKRATDPVLFLGYGGGKSYSATTGSSKEDASAQVFHQISQWLDDGMLDAAIVEVRRIRFHRLKGILDEVSEQRSLLWSEYRTEVIPFDSPDLDAQVDTKQMETVVMRAFDLLDHEPAEETIEDVITTAEGNPEIAKIAAKFAQRDDTSLDEFDSAHGVVWRDIKGMVDENPEGLDGCDGLFEFLCAVRRATTENLQGIKDEPKRCKSTYGGYIDQRVSDSDKKGEEDQEVEHWQVSPEIYADVVFRYCGLEFSRNLTSDKLRIEMYRDYIEEEDLDVLWPGLAESLATEYDFVTRESTLDEDYWEQSVENLDISQYRNSVHTYRELVISEIEELLSIVESDDVHPVAWFFVFETLTFADVPVDFAVITSNVERIAGVAANRAGSLDKNINPKSVPSSLLARQLLIHAIENKKMSNDALVSVAAWFDSQNMIGPAAFLTNVYSMALSNLADDYPDPTTDQVQDWLDILQDRTITVANLDEDDQPDDPATFLENVYSMALSKLASNHPDPTTDRVQAWIPTMIGQTAKAAQNTNELDEIAFTARVSASSTVSIRTITPKEAARTWEYTICVSAINAVDSDELETFSFEFHGTTHIMCEQRGVLPLVLSTLIEILLDHSIDTEEPLLERREERVALIAANVALATVGMWAFGDENLDLNPGRNTARLPGKAAGTDPGFVRAVIAATDERLADRDWPDWFNENGDTDKPLDPLRDRVLAHGCAAAIETLADEQRADFDERPSPEQFAHEIVFDHDDATTRLYRAGLRAVRDGESATARRCFRATWVRREGTDEGQQDEYAVAAGVFYAAHLTMQDDPDQLPETVVKAIHDSDTVLSDPVDAVLTAVNQDDADIDPEAFVADGVADGEHSIDALESLASVQILKKIVEPSEADPEEIDAAVEEPLVEGLNHLNDGDIPAATSSLLEAWDARPDNAGTVSHRYATIAAVTVVALAREHPAVVSIENEVLSALDRDGAAIPAVVQPFWNGDEVDDDVLCKQADDLPAHGDLIVEAFRTIRSEGLT